MTDRFISDESAAAYLLRQWLEHDAERAAALVWWGYYSPAEALEELQGLGRLADIRARGMGCPVDAVARDMLVEAYRRQGDRHALTMKAVEQTVLEVLRSSGSREDAARAAGAIARMQTLRPPPFVVPAGVENAVREMRRSRQWQRAWTGAS